MIYFIFDPKFTKHITGYGHPEQPARVVAIEQALVKSGLKRPENSMSPRLALEEEILLCHTKPYFDLAKREVDALENGELKMLSSGDVVISPESFEVALLSAGAAIVAVDTVMRHPESTAFSIARPPGHHACSDRGMGFCLFNNIAIAARYAQKKYGIKRVLIVDWDVHHGNGTEEIFYEDPSVFYFSTHEKGLYPMTGAADEVGFGRGTGANLNMPIASGINSRIEVIKAFQKDLKEAADRFQPELVMISAGFDGHERDPLGHFNLTDNDFFELTKLVKEIADKYAEGRIVSVLEGGYNLAALASSAVAHASALTGAY